MKTDAKKQVLQMLAKLMEKTDGAKFKPKEIHVEMLTTKPMDEEGEEKREAMGKPTLADMLHEACETPEEEMEEHEEDEFTGEDAKKMSLKDFLASRSKK